MIIITEEQHQTYRAPERSLIPNQRKDVIRINVNETKMRSVATEAK